MNLSDATPFKGESNDAPDDNAKKAIGKIKTTSD